MLLVLQPTLEIDAIGPHVDVASGRQVAPAPALVLGLPLRLQAADHAAAAPTSQRRPCRATPPAPPGSPRWTRHEGRASAKPHPATASAARNEGQNGRRETDALSSDAATVPDLRAPHRHRTNASQDRPFRPVAMTHKAPAAVFGLQMFGWAPSHAPPARRQPPLQWPVPGARELRRGVLPVSGSAVTPGWCSATTLSSVMAYHSLLGDREASSPPRYATSIPITSARHPLSAIASAKPLQRPLRARMADVKRMRSPPTLPRRFGRRTDTGLPVRIARSGPDDAQGAGGRLRSSDVHASPTAATSASMACARSSRAPARTSAGSAAATRQHYLPSWRITPCWRPGGFVTPHDTPPPSLSPSPTPAIARSCLMRGARRASKS